MSTSQDIANITYIEYCHASENAIAKPVNKLKIEALETKMQEKLQKMLEECNCNTNDDQTVTTTEDTMQTIINNVSKAIIDHKYDKYVDHYHPAGYRSQDLLTQRINIATTPTVLQAFTHILQDPASTGPTMQKMLTNTLANTIIKFRRLLSKCYTETVHDPYSLAYFQHQCQNIKRLCAEALNFQQYCFDVHIDKWRAELKNNQSDLLHPPKGLTTKKFNVYNIFIQFHGTMIARFQIEKYCYLFNGLACIRQGIPRKALVAAEPLPDTTIMDILDEIICDPKKCILPYKPDPQKMNQDIHKASDYVALEDKYYELCFNLINDNLGGKLDNLQRQLKALGRMLLNMLQNKHRISNYPRPSCKAVCSVLQYVDFKGERAQILIRAIFSKYLVNTISETFAIKTTLQEPIIQVLNSLYYAQTPRFKDVSKPIQSNDDLRELVKLYAQHNKAQIYDFNNTDIKETYIKEFVDVLTSQMINDLQSHDIEYFNSKIMPNDANPSGITVAAYIHSRHNKMVMASYIEYSNVMQAIQTNVTEQQLDSLVQQHVKNPNTIYLLKSSLKQKHADLLDRHMVNLMALSIASPRQQTPVTAAITTPQASIITTTSITSSAGSTTTATSTSSAIITSAYIITPAGPVITTTIDKTSTRPTSATTSRPISATTQSAASSTTVPGSEFMNSQDAEYFITIQGAESSTTAPGSEFMNAQDAGESLISESISAPVVSSYLPHSLPQTQLASSSALSTYNINLQPSGTFYSWKSKIGSILNIPIVTMCLIFILLVSMGIIAKNTYYAKNTHQRQGVQNIKKSRTKKIGNIS